MIEQRFLPALKISTVSTEESHAGAASHSRGLFGGQVRALIFPLHPHDGTAVNGLLLRVVRQKNADFLPSKVLPLELYKNVFGSLFSKDF